MARRDYAGDGIVVHWDSELCEHSMRCFTGLPEVFDTERRPWVDVGGADAARIAATVDTCPSRALTYSRTDGAPLGPNGVEGAPPSSGDRQASPGGGQEERALDAPPSVTPRQDGPVVVEGTIVLVGPDGTAEEHTGRTFLCRCGGSASKPLCDGSHKRIGFTAPGVPVARKPDRP
jgi:uncharacterized Fe-S cluster protein YjdI/CDGSH-type Zn-finger protein